MPDHPRPTTPDPTVTPPTNDGDDVDSAYKPMGPGRDCTLDAAAKEKGWNNTTPFGSAWVDENAHARWSNEKTRARVTGECASLGETTLVAMRKKALAESARVGLARAGRKPLTPRALRDVSSVVTVGVEHPRCDERDPVIETRIDLDTYHTRHVKRNLLRVIVHASTSGGRASRPHL